MGHQQQGPVEAKLSDTLFLRNLSYDTEEDELKQMFEENFGQLEYALICRNKETSESKGTAFVKFKEAEKAKQCLLEYKDMELQTKFHLNGRNIVPLEALSRDDVSVLKKPEKSRDKRNLYLAREGAIVPSSEAANEMSKEDLKKRMELEERKRKCLTNLHYFVSQTRLCIHNLPPWVNDQKLKQIVIDAVKDKTVKVVESRVMKNKKGKDTETTELGKSKGFGFVELTKHEHALDALRRLNNNPEIFTKDRRPIVEFSMENMVALNKKKVRLIRSVKKLDQKGQVKKKEILDKIAPKRGRSNKNKQPHHIKSNVDEKPKAGGKNPMVTPKYGGIMSRPPGPNDIVRVPKLNRKFWRNKAQSKKKTKKDKKCLNSKTKIK